jgi:hypothetical protein
MMVSYFELGEKIGGFVLTLFLLYMGLKLIGGKKKDGESN